MRHGKTAADVRQIFSDPNDALAEEGLYAPRRAAKRIASTRPPRRALSSPFVRLRRTADEVGRRSGVSVEVDRDLWERNSGELAAQTKEWTSQRSCLPHETAPGGETLIALRVWVETFWARPTSHSEPGHQVLIVSHGQMIGMLFRCFVRLPIDDSARPKMGVTAVHCRRLAGASRIITFLDSRMYPEVA